MPIDQDSMNLIAAIGQRGDEVTDLLVAYVAATVLMRVHEHPESMEQRGSDKPWPFVVSFSPHDMDDMQRRYDVNRQMMPDGRQRVYLTPRADLAPSLWVQDEDPTGFKAQAAPPPKTYIEERPFVFLRVGTTLKAFPNVDAAEREARQMNPSVAVKLERRACPRSDCPNAPSHRQPCALCVVPEPDDRK